MLEMTNVFAETKNREAFFKFSSLNKYWASACDPENVTEVEIDLEKVTPEEVKSIGLKWKCVRVLIVTGSVNDNNYNTHFKNVADYFPNVCELIISGHIDLKLPSLCAISRMKNLEHLRLEVYDFSSKGVMMMRESLSLKTLHASSALTTCKIFVDKLVNKEGDKETLLEEVHMHLHVMFGNEYEPYPAKAMRFDGFDFDDAFPVDLE